MIKNLLNNRMTFIVIVLSAILSFYWYRANLLNTEFFDLTESMQSNYKTESCKIKIKRNYSFFQGYTPESLDIEFKVEDSDSINVRWKPYKSNRIHLSTGGVQYEYFWNQGENVIRLQIVHLMFRNIIKNMSVKICPNQGQCSQPVQEISCVLYN